MLCNANVKVGSNAGKTVENIWELVEGSKSNTEIVFWKEWHIYCLIVQANDGFFIGLDFQILS